MPAAPAKRRYHAPRRQAAKEETRRTILASARSTFLERGYAATTMAAIADGASVAVDTVYATMGNKPAVFRLLVETALSGSAEPVTALERDYVQAKWAAFHMVRTTASTLAFAMVILSNLMRAALPG